MLGSRQTTLALALVASVFWIIMVASSRERPWGDAHPIYDVAESTAAAFLAPHMGKVGS